MYLVHFHQHNGLGQVSRLGHLLLLFGFSETFHQTFLEFISPIYCARPRCRHNTTTTTTTTLFVLAFVLTGGIKHQHKEATPRGAHRLCGALKHQQSDGTTWSAQPVRAATQTLTDAP